MNLRSLLFFLMLTIILTACKKKDNKNNDGHYYFEMEIDGQNFSFTYKYPQDLNDPFLLFGSYNSAVGVYAGRTICHEPGTVCYGFSLSVNKQKPGTYDPDVIAVQITDNNNNVINYTYYPNRNLGTISCSITKINLYEYPDNLGLIEGTFSGTIAKDYGFDGQPGQLVSIKGKFGAPNVN